MKIKRKFAKEETKAFAQITFDTSVLRIAVLIAY